MLCNSLINKKMQIQDERLFPFLKKYLDTIVIIDYIFLKNVTGYIFGLVSECLPTMGCSLCKFVK